ncbi:MAG: hypothetical protein HY455_00660 [Parcubacteria group bacterium]|nr:hypothetical protein [Parcubacteria group bacterium]
MATQEQARAVLNSMKKDLREKRVGSSLSRDARGNWFITLRVTRPLKDGTFPKQKDGVRIEQKFVGRIRALPKDSETKKKRPTRRRRA